MRIEAYPAEITPEGSQWNVRFPDLPDAITQGESVMDAKEMAEDCLAETIGARIADHQPIPMPSDQGYTMYKIPLREDVSIKAEKYLIFMQKKGEAISDLLRAASRYASIQRDPNIDIEKKGAALMALGLAALAVDNIKEESSYEN